MTKAEYEKLFEKIYNLFVSARLYHELSIALQNPNYNTIYNDHSWFWQATLSSLRNNALLSLANLYETSSHVKSGQTLSVFSLTDKQGDKSRKEEAKKILAKNRLKIAKLTLLRDKVLSHVDIKELLGKRKKGLGPLKRFEVEELLGIAEDLLSAIHPEPSHGYSFKTLEDQAKEDVKDIMQRLKVVKLLEKRHRDYFKSGKVADPDFFRHVTNIK